MSLGTPADELRYLWVKYDASSLLDLAFRMVVAQDHRDVTTRGLAVLDLLLAESDGSETHTPTECKLIASLVDMLIEFWAEVY